MGVGPEIVSDEELLKSSEGTSARRLIELSISISDFSSAVQAEGKKNWRHLCYLFRSDRR